MKLLNELCLPLFEVQVNHWIHQMGVEENSHFKGKTYHFGFFSEYV